jgi:hypothetical protein
MLCFIPYLFFIMLNFTLRIETVPGAGGSTYAFRPLV